MKGGKNGEGIKERKRRIRGKIKKRVKRGEKNKR